MFQSYCLGGYIWSCLTVKVTSCGHGISTSGGARLHLHLVKAVLNKLQYFYTVFSKGQTTLFNVKVVTCNDKPTQWGYTRLFEEKAFSLKMKVEHTTQTSVLQKWNLSYNYIGGKKVCVTTSFSNMTKHFKG